MAKSAARAGGGKGGRNLATNRSARFEYHLLETFEAGIALLGPEVKSIREGRVQLKEAHVRLSADGEAFLVGAHVSPWSHAGHDPPDPVRTRKLLLHAREIRRLRKTLDGTGMTIVPTRMYLKNGRIKVEIAIARGKRAHDKRESIKKREATREIERATSRR